jgi:hypothetical protein
MLLSIVILVSTLNTIVIAEGENEDTANQESNIRIECNMSVKPEELNGEDNQFVRVSVYWAPRLAQEDTTNDSASLDWGKGETGVDRQAQKVCVFDLTKNPHIDFNEVYKHSNWSNDSYYAWYNYSADYIGDTRGQIVWGSGEQFYIKEGVDDNHKAATYTAATIESKESIIEELSKLEQLLNGGSINISELNNNVILKSIASNMSTVDNVDDILKGIMKGKDDTGEIYSIYGGYLITFEIGVYREVAEIKKSSVNEESQNVMSAYTYNDVIAWNKSSDKIDWYSEAEGITLTDLRPKLSKADGGAYDKSDDIVDKLKNSISTLEGDGNSIKHTIPIFNNEEANNYVICNDNKYGVGAICFSWAGDIPEQSNDTNTTIDGIPIIKYYYDATSKGISMQGPNEMFNSSAEFIKVDTTYNSDGTYKAQATDWIDSEAYDLRGFVVLNTREDTGLGTRISVGNKENILIYNGTEKHMGSIDIDEKTKNSNYIDSKVNANLVSAPFIGSSFNRDSGSADNIAAVAALGMTESECRDRFSRNLSVNSKTGDGDYDKKLNDESKVFDTSTFTYTPLELKDGITEVNPNGNTQLVLLYVKGACDLPRMPLKDGVIDRNEAINYIYVTKYYYDYDSDATVVKGAEENEANSYYPRHINRERVIESDLLIPGRSTPEPNVKTSSLTVTVEEDTSNTDNNGSSVEDKDNIEDIVKDLKDNNTEPDDTTAYELYQVILVNHTPDENGVRWYSDLDSWYAVADKWANTTGQKRIYSISDYIQEDNKEAIGDVINIQKGDGVNILRNSLKEAEDNTYKEVFIKYTNGEVPNDDTTDLAIIKPIIKDSTKWVEISQKRITRAINFKKDLGINPEVTFEGSRINLQHTHTYPVTKTCSGGKHRYTISVNRNAYYSTKSIDGYADYVQAINDAKDGNGIYHENTTDDAGNPTPIPWDKSDGNLRFVTENYNKNDLSKEENYVANGFTAKYEDNTTYKYNLDKQYTSESETSKTSNDA